jgi:hypothetical protein
VPVVLFSLAGCVAAEDIELQSTETRRTHLSDEQLTERTLGLGRELQTYVRTGQNGVGFYANFDVGACHYAVQRYRDGRLTIDAYWYSKRRSARCDRAPALGELRGVLGP